MDINIQEPNPGILLIMADTQYEITSLFLRMQEFYESPFEEINSKFFSLETYMDIYAEKNGNFTYTTDWNGFNVPGTEVKKFFTEFKNSLLLKESDLYMVLVKRFGETDPSKWTNDFYLIGTHKNAGVNTVMHEISHALYYLDDNFRHLMKVQMHIYWDDAKADAIHKALADMGYCEDVLWDEMQAYVNTSSWWELISKFGFFNIEYSTAKRMRKIFREKTKWSDDL